MLLPLIFTIARKLEDSNTIKGSAYIAIGVPVIAALCTMHGMVLLAMVNMSGKSMMSPTSKNIGMPMINAASAMSHGKR